MNTIETRSPHETDPSAHYPGYDRLMDCGEEWLEVGGHGPFVTEGALEFPVSMVTSFKDEAALFFDYNLRRLAGMEIMAELHLGEGLDRIKHQLTRLGYARLS